MQMSAQVFVASLALLVSVTSLVVTLISYKSQIRINAIHKNIEAISKVEMLAVEHPEVLRLHGIDPAELTRIGISPVEFAYLVANFSAGAIFYDLPGKKDVTPFGSETYRWRMLSCASTRAAWRLVRTFLDEGVFVERVDSTIKEIEAAEARRAGSVAG